MGRNVELYSTCSSFSAVFIMGNHLENFRNLSQSSVFQSWGRQEEQRPLQDLFGKWYYNARLLMKRLLIRDSVAVGGFFSGNEEFCFRSWSYNFPT
ncbi:hypothetical protein CDAR_268851 [Caerostris darwini]|uniref:Ycf2 n=1 Tax=Caerostris darwini TaxID=1538125 RepID=A0AAV4V696_9ARAC|nr:hypothetical protein CDAR_268851 [Caerostris darwini]